jgi:plastocyanin
MTRRARNTTWSALLLALSAVAVAAAFLPILAERGEPRVIEIVMREMAFHVGDDPDPNAAIRLAPGETVMLVVENQDAGIVHDFSIPAWEAGTPRLRVGESHQVVFTAPRHKGTTDYLCTPHSGMMRGSIVVE